MAAGSSILSGLSQVLLPKGSRGTKGGVSFTPTFKPGVPLLPLPQYRDHLTDVYTTRIASDSRALIQTLAITDPDISAAIHAFLTVAGSSEPVIYAYDEKNEIDQVGIVLGQQLLALLTTTNDYTQGYSNKPTPSALINDHRYLVLIRGGTAAELVFDKAYLPVELRAVDPATLVWNQAQNGSYQPQQRPVGSGVLLDLNIPSFFVSNFHQSPLDMYTYSTFVSAINTIASRTLVINELYRIMKVVGYPRVDIQVLEDVLMAAAPPAMRSDPVKIRTYVEGEISRIRQSVANLGAADAFIHSSAIEAKIINEKNPAAGLQISEVIEVLNAQNQAALKVMPAVVGKSDNGQVASTEARLFALGADALNKVIASLFTKVLTFGARLAGYPGRIECVFPPVELRPVYELEAQKTMRSARLKNDLSVGLISDIQYSMEMYQRPPLAGQKPLSGTGFMAPVPAAGGTGIDVNKASPNGDPLGRSLTGEGHNGARSNSSAGANNQGG